MSFLRDAVTVVSGLLRKSIADYPPLVVVDVKPDEYVYRKIVLRGESIMLYGIPETSLYEVVLHKDIPSKTPHQAFSICRSTKSEEAERYFKMLADKLPLLLTVCPNVITTTSLQEIFDYVREHPHQSLAHIAAYFGFIDCFKHSQIVQNEVNYVDPDNQMTVLQVAVKSGRLPSVIAVMSLNPKLDLCDKDHNNVLHFAASTTKEIIQAICSPPQTSAYDLLQLINSRNADNYSPLHLACLHDKPECVKELLKNGADVNGASILEKTNDELSYDLRKNTVIDDLDPKDMKNGGTPLHWARSPQCMEALIEMGCNIDARNFQGESVLHLMVVRGKLDCVVLLLSYGADVNAKGPNGNSPLHLAVKGRDVTIVQALIVFGASVDMVNSMGETARHLTAIGRRNEKQDLILYVLHAVGAKRCTVNRSNCTDGCAQSTGSQFNGIPPESSPFKRSVKLYNELLGEAIVKNAVAQRKHRSLVDNSSNEQMDCDSNEVQIIENTCRILCLDGGGIRGLILIQMLSYLEERMGKKITECFDLIAGTSTGGILALSIALGRSANECRKLYFKLKDRIFIGSRPYESDPLERFLQKELGEDVRMGDIKKPRVMITATLADRFPAGLQLFRNYDSTEEILGNIDSSQSSPLDQLVWRAARSSGAAPTYFRPCGRYLDGGLISNNPTLDAITEVHNINKAFEATGQESKKMKLSVVVSLGTGAIPVNSVPVIDMHRPDSLYGVAKMAFMASSLGQLLVEQASQADGQVVERAMSWCSMIDVPYFRLNPPISEDISLDETNVTKLVNMLWETTAYMNSRESEIAELITLLQ